MAEEISIKIYLLCDFFLSFLSVCFLYSPSSSSVVLLLLLLRFSLSLLLLRLLDLCLDRFSFFLLDFDFTSMERLLSFSLELLVLLLSVLSFEELRSKLMVSIILVSITLSFIEESSIISIESRLLGGDLDLSLTRSMVFIGVVVSDSFCFRNAAARRFLSSCKALSFEIAASFSLAARASLSLILSSAKKN